jgi:hypothetical protein
VPWGISLTVFAGVPSATGLLNHVHSLGQAEPARIRQIRVVDGITGN